MTAEAVEHLDAAPGRLTAADVVASLRRRYGAERDGIGPEWALLDEFTLRPGAGVQRADVFAVRAWGGRPKGHERHAIEVKVSRSDLLAELANPHKAAPFEQVAHRFYLAVPVGLVKDSDPVPAHWGIYETTKGSCRKKREATRNDTPAPLPEAALVEAFRRASRSEARIRGAAQTAADDPARIPALAKQVDAARAAEQRAKRAAQRDKDRLRDLLHRIGAAGGWLCVCGKPMKRALDSYSRQEHVDGTGCDQHRYGPTTDWGSLAVRLGVVLDDSADAGADDLRARLSLGFATEPTPVETLLTAHALVVETLDTVQRVVASPEGATEALALSGQALAQLEALLAATEPVAGSLR